MKSRVLGCLLACTLSACGETVELNGVPDAAGVVPTRDSASASSSVDEDAAVHDGPDAGSPFPALDSASPPGVDFDARTPSGSGPRITVNPTVYRFYPGTAMMAYPFRAANLSPNDIDAADCDAGILLQFNLTISGLPTTDTIQVWAGTTDCSQTSARELGAGPYCRQVAPPGTFGNSSQAFGSIYARNIVRFLASSTDANELDAVTSVPGPSVCQPLGSPSACVVPLNLYFLYFPAGVGSGGTPDSYTVYSQPVLVSPPSGGVCPGG